MNYSSTAPAPLAHEPPRGWKAARIGLLAGAVAGVVMSTVMLLLWKLFGVATPIPLIGDRLSAVIPAGPFLDLMGKVGGYNHMKQLGVGSVIAGQIIVGAIGGWIYAIVLGRNAISPSNRDRFSIVFFTLLPILVFAAALWPVLGTHYKGLPIGLAMLVTVAGLLLAFALFERTLVTSFAWLTGPPSKPAEMEYSPNVGRRALVLGGLGAVAGLGSAGLLRKLYKEATFSYDGTQYRGKEVQPITPNDKFYTVTKNVVDPKVNPALWRLEVSGMVENDKTYTIEELKSLPSVTQETTLMCISNQLEMGLMSNAVWKGVPLKALLEPAKADSDAKRVLFHGVDNYTDTIPLEKALNPTTLVVYEMNGTPLPDRHGAPARIIVPGYFGEKHVKWITRIEVTDDDAQGFYEKQGWGPNFIVPIRSRFDDPDNNAQLELARSGNGLLLKGVAFGGDRGVSRVEVSLDGGETWQEAKIDYPGTELTWALWSYNWRPSAAGEHKLSVRATDRTGAVQELDEERPKTSGVTGFHEITVRIV